MLTARSPLAKRAAVRPAMPGRVQHCSVRATAEAKAAAPPVHQPAPNPQLRNAGPEPKKFAVAEGQLWNIASASIPAILRLASGGLAVGYKVSLAKDDGAYAVARAAGFKVLETSTVSSLPRPAQPLELYEYEACPFCKKVREVVSTLDLDVRVYPCPKDGPTWRPKAIAEGGKKQFPYLVDPNTGKSMYESDDIVKYLWATYGPGGDVPLALRLGPLTTITCGLGSLPRATKGNVYKPAKQPEKPLVFWGYEISPFVKVVRETLAEYELPYLYVTTPRGSPKRQQLLDARGAFQVPYLEDPNTGVYLFESAAINEYLHKTYGKSA